MSALIISQALIISKLISRRSNAKSHRTRRRALLTLKKFWEEWKPEKARPRVWTFVKSSVFLEETLNLPDDIFSKKFRFSKASFYELVENVRPELTKQCVLREPISVIKRVAIGIYVLKSGSDYSVVADVFGVSKSSVCRILDEFLEAVIQRFYKIKIRFPMSANDQEQTANEFEENYQFPDCVGALDGSHIPILTPDENGADYYNYKGWHSIILLGIVDSHSRFLWINVGQPGKCNDGAAWGSSKFGQDTSIIRAPYHLIADSAFPLSIKIMKPYPIHGVNAGESNFNYRLSRARMTVECAFGRLKARFRILLKRCDWNLTKFVKCVQVCCILHNIAEENKEIFVEGWLKRVEEFDNRFPQPQQHNFNAPNQNHARAQGNRKRTDIAHQLL